MFSSLSHRSTSFALLLLGLAACHQDDDDPASRGPDGGTPDATVRFFDGAVLPDKCCPPSPTPSCCMSYGGLKKNDSCSTVCDGMPNSTDPAWHLVKDADGCPKWSSAGATGPCCGGVRLPPDAGPQLYQCFGDPE